MKSKNKCLTNKNKLVSLVGLSELYPDSFPIERVRYLAHPTRRDENEFSSCLSRIGNKFYVNLDDFDKWIESRKLIKKVKCK